MSLQGKTALVTGAAGGFGRTIAEQLLAQGANLIICDVDAARLALLEPQLPPDRALLHHADISSEPAVLALVARAVERFGHLDIVVNNAGVMDRYDAADTCALDVWERVLRVNLTGAFLVTKHALPGMQARGRGVFVNVCSVAAERGGCAGVAYTASKHGLLGLTRNTAAFHGAEGVYSVAVVMGAMLGTNIADGMAGAAFNAERAAQSKAMYAGMEPINVEGAARHVVSLCVGDTAKLVNGSTVHLTNNWPPS